MPELYLFLILLTRKFKNISKNEEISKLLTGIITWLKWFDGGKTDVYKLISEIYYNMDELTIVNLKEKTKNIIPYIRTPKEFEDFLKLPQIENIKDEDTEKIIASWRFGTLISDSDENKEKWEVFLNALRGNRVILLYAQREYLKKRFNSFDPARKDLWENHNRPWDYDHIFAKKYANNIKSNNTFLYFCQEWRDSNGNMRAWPFEANRSDQAELAIDKINAENMINSFIDSSEIEGFSVGYSAVRNAKDALKFASSCRSRLVRIYKEWFTVLYIEKLLEINNKS